MEEQIINFETAKLAKEKGFDLPVNHYYYIDRNNEVKLDNGDGDSEHICLDHNQYNYFSAPTQAFLQKWLREAHKIHIEISVGTDTEYGVIYGTVDNPEWIREEDDIDVLFFPTYEEALEAGLQKALKLIP